MTLGHNRYFVESNVSQCVRAPVYFNNNIIPTLIVHRNRLQRDRRRSAKRNESHCVQFFNIMRNHRNYAY